jgi:hypothetical protein
MEPIVAGEVIIFRYFHRPSAVCARAAAPTPRELRPPRSAAIFIFLLSNKRTKEHYKRTIQDKNWDKNEICASKRRF